MPITNPRLENYYFLKILQENENYPDFMVQKGIHILKDLCIQIESEKPTTQKEVAGLINSAILQFNDLQAALNEDPGPQDAITRRIISENFNVILDAYGYDFDMEDIFPESGSMQYQSPLL